jgi:hypothetical protein
MSAYLFMFVSGFWSCVRLLILRPSPDKRGRYRAYVAERGGPRDLPPLNGSREIQTDPDLSDSKPVPVPLPVQLNLVMSRHTAQ